jgi:VanZ family protein
LTPRHRSSATPLALAMAALVLYASLYPFSGWRWPPGSDLATLLRLPWPPWVDRLDQLFNLVGYLPLGLLAMVAARRSGQGMSWSLAIAVLGPTMMSYLTEVTQSFLPGRHPSLKDLLMNSVGAACGAAIAVLLQSLGLIGRWHGVRERWFRRRSAGALALLTLWPVGLLFPSPAPWGLGQFDDRLRELVGEVLVDVSWAEPVYLLLIAPEEAQPLGRVAEVAMSTLGPLAPCMLAFAVAVAGWRRLALAAGALALGVGGMTLSTLLNFGPQHAMSWMTPSTTTSLVAAAVIALLASLASNRVAVGLGLVVLTGLVVLVAQAPADPYFADNLQAWEQGRFVRFHGLAQWIGWLWPYLALLWLLTRLGHRD